jgi:hypothetical protein
MTATIGTRSGRLGLVLLWTATIVTGGSLLLAVAPRARQSEAQAAVRIAEYRGLARSAEELARLRGADQPGSQADTQDAEPKLATAVTGALGAAGLPASALASLSPESESGELLRQGARGASTTGARTMLVRWRATLVLTPLTLPQLGRFLTTWRERSPQWTPSRIDIEPRREKDVQPGADLPLRVTVGLESVTVQNRQGRSP